MKANDAHRAIILRVDLENPFSGNGSVSFVDIVWARIGFARLGWILELKDNPFDLSRVPYMIEIAIVERHVYFSRTRQIATRIKQETLSLSGGDTYGLLSIEMYYWLLLLFGWRMKGHLSRCLYRSK